MTTKRKSTRPYTLASLKYLYDQKKLWLNPEYQRESVWVLSQKQLFIDSLLRDLDIPKLYFREIDKAGYEYEVVDGQQRLRAVFEYFTDSYGLSVDADPVDGRETRRRLFTKLHTDLQVSLQTAALDVVVLNAAYDDDDIEEMFLRLQNGTPLNAAEKRRAINGTMRTVVQNLAKHKAFALCAFKNKRFAYEDASAKILHLLLAGSITDIRPGSIRRTYESHSHITSTDAHVVKAEKALRFMVKAFRHTHSPRLKKFAIISLTYLTTDLLDRYTLAASPVQYAKAYLRFELERRKNEELPEDQQDPRLSAYTDAARADSIQDLQYRHEVLRDAIIRGIPELALKDPTRGFSDEQRMAIYWRDEGKCRKCGQECDVAAFHADHVKAHSRGGSTSLENGQVLCPTCNAKKGARGR